jgi:lipopolysaccharide export system protein LptA
MTGKTFAERRRNWRASTSVIAALAGGALLGGGLSFDAARALAQPRAPSAAHGGSSGITQSLSANASKPVEIEAATLVVDDKKKTATFNGNVVVVQGDVKLKANEIVIHYVNSDKSAAGGAKSAAIPATLTGGGGGSTDISTIDATGNVLVNTVNDQNVSGERATYDVKAQTIVVTGKKVVVSQGGSILHGQRLTVNVADGTYRMDSRPNGKKSGRLVLRITPSEVESMKAHTDATKAQGEARPRKKPARAARRPGPPEAGSWRPESSDQ